MISDLILSKKIKEITDNIMKCEDYTIEESVIIVASQLEYNDYDINTVCIVSQESVDIDLTSKTIMIAEDNIVTFSKANFGQKARGQVFRGNLTVKHMSGTFIPYELNVIIIRPVGL